MSITDQFVDRLIEEMNIETMFTIPLFGGIPVTEGVVVSWIIIALLTLLSIILVRNLKVENPGKKQIILESIVNGIHGFLYKIVGENGKQYIPYLTTVILYIAFANTIFPLLGFKPPTKEMNTTAALAIMSIVLIVYAGIRHKGLKGWGKHLAEPMALVAPLNVLEIFTRPLSLCIRLFGNMLGGFVIMELIKILIPVGIPVVFSLYFDIFDGLLQAYIFVLLTSIFISEAVED